MLHKPLLLPSLCAALHASDLRLAAGESQRHCPTTTLETYMNMWEGVSTTTDAPDGLLRAAQTCNGGMCINIQDPNAINGITYLQFGDILTYQITLTNQSVTLNGTNTLTFSLDPSLTFTGGTAGWNPAGGNTYQRTIPNNGFPQTYTLTAQMNLSNTSTCLQGGMQSSATLLFNGNNTVSETKDVYSIPDNYVRMSNIMASSVPLGVLSGNIFLENTLYVDANLFMPNCHLLLASGARIWVGSFNAQGVSLLISKSHIGSCNTVMWEGITVSPKCLLSVMRTTISDAYRAIDFKEKSIGIIRTTTFDRNRDAIYADMPAPGLSPNITFEGENQFKFSASSLAQAYQGQPHANGGRPHAGILLNRATLSVNKPAKCTFDNLNMGICATSSTLSLENCFFTNIMPDNTGQYSSLPMNPSFPSNRNGSAVSTDKGDLKYYGPGLPPNSNTAMVFDFIECHQGVLCYAANVDIRNANMSHTITYGIRLDLQRQDHPTIVRRNSIESYKVCESRVDSKKHKKLINSSLII